MKIKYLICSSFWCSQFFKVLSINRFKLAFSRTSVITCLRRLFNSSILAIFCRSIFFRRHTSFEQFYKFKFIFFRSFFSNTLIIIVVIMIYAFFSLILIISFLFGNRALFTFIFWPFNA